MKKSEPIKICIRCKKVFHRKAEISVNKFLIKKFCSFECRKDPEFAHLTGKERISAISKRAYQNNREKILNNQKKRLQTNPEKRKRYEHEYYLLNKKTIIYKTTTWRKNNPEIVRMSWKRRQYKERGAEGNHTLEEWENLKQLYEYTCPMCFRTEPEIKLTEDHKIPISKNGSNGIDNIQPLCKSCNSRKNAKTWFASCPINYMQNANSTILA